MFNELVVQLFQLITGFNYVEVVPPRVDCLCVSFALALAHRFDAAK